MYDLVDELESSGAGDGGGTLETGHGEEEQQVVELVVYLQFEAVLDEVTQEGHELVDVRLEQRLRLLDDAQFAAGVRLAVGVDQLDDRNALVLESGHDVQEALETNVLEEHLGGNAI